MKRLFFLLALVGLFGCTNGTDTPSSTISKTTEVNGAVDYQKMAQAYCVCSENTIAVNEKLKTVMEGGDNAAFEALLPVADASFKEAMACCEKAKTKLGVGDPDQKQLAQSLKSECSKLPAQLLLKLVKDIN